MLEIIIYLLEHYSSYNILSLNSFDHINDELILAGFKQEAVSQAIQWLEGLTFKTAQKHEAHYPLSVRPFTSKEKKKLPTNCQNFLLFLEQTQILTTYSRELIIEKAMTLGTPVIELSQLKLISILALSQQTGKVPQLPFLAELVFLENKTLH